MNIIESIINKDKILTAENTPTCPKCKCKYYSPFDKIYIAVKGVCYSCEEDEILADNILNNI